MLWLTVDNRGVDHDAGQIGVRDCFVQDETSDAVDRNIIKSLTGAAEGVCVCVSDKTRQEEMNRRVKQREGIAPGFPLWQPCFTLKEWKRKC